MKYYYSSPSGQVIGPIEFNELAQLAGAGSIHEHTAVIAEGAQTWSTFAQVRESAAPARAAAPASRGVNRVADVIKAFSWGQFLFGLLLVFLSGFTLPWAILRHCGRDLASWGTSRALPSSESDLPALTHLLIVVRPFTHVIFTATMAVIAILALFGRGPGYLGYYGYHLSHAISGCVGALLVGYFGNWVIAFVYDLFSAIVRIANDVKRLAQR
jgi:hypothetical protein